MIIYYNLELWLITIRLCILMATRILIECILIRFN